MASKRGGSYASDAVTGLVDVASYEKVEFVMKGGSPILSIPMLSQDSTPSSLSTSMVTSLAQPTGNNTPFTNNMTFPTYFQNFSPYLFGGDGKAMKARKDRKDRKTIAKGKAK